MHTQWILFSVEKMLRKVNRSQILVISWPAPSTPPMETPARARYICAQICKGATAHFSKAEDQGTSESSFSLTLSAVEFFVPFDTIVYVSGTSMKRTTYNNTMNPVRWSFSLLSGCRGRNRHFLANKLDREQVLYTFPYVIISITLNYFRCPRFYSSSFFGERFISGVVHLTYHYFLSGHRLRYRPDKIKIIYQIFQGKIKTIR